MLLNPVMATYSEHARIQQLQEAIDQLGGNSEVARAFGVSRAAVCQWVASGRVPLKRVRKLSQMTGLPWGILNPELEAPERAA